MQTFVYGWNKFYFSLSKQFWDKKNLTATFLALLSAFFFACNFLSKILFSISSNSSRVNGRNVGRSGSILKLVKTGLNWLKLDFFNYRKAALHDTNESHRFFPWLFILQRNLRESFSVFWKSFLLHFQFFFQGYLRMLSALLL